MPPRSLLTSGSTVATASASKPTRVIVETSPNVIARRPRARTPSGGALVPASGCTAGSRTRQWCTPRVTSARISFRNSTVARQERVRGRVTSAQNEYRRFRRRDTTTRDPAASQPHRPDTRPCVVGRPPTSARVRGGRGQHRRLSHVSLVIIVIAVVLVAYAALSALLSINVIGPT